MLFRILIIVTLVLIVNTTHARWITKADANIEIRFLSDIYIKRNGTSTETVELKIKILNESGRENTATQILSYNRDTTKIEILDAKTINQGKVFYVPDQNIQDKSVATSINSSGFDETGQILIGFPNVQVGSEIYLKYKTTVSKTNIPDYFESTALIGTGGYWQSSQIKYTSEIPLYFKVNDPDKIFKIIQNKTANNASGLYNIIINQQTPYSRDTVNEPENSRVNSKYYAWVAVSSLEHFEDLGRLEAPRYISKLSQPLPTTLTSILSKATKANGEVEQINTVTSALNEKIQYMGDWRTVEGRFVPRDLEKIAATEHGDCKDFALSTAAILKKLGYKTLFALVHRGMGFTPDTGSIPRQANFNHVILKVYGKSGKTYWIDPTNFVSMANGIFPDIADKTALILDPEKPYLEKIPDISPDNAQTDFIAEINTDSGSAAQYVDTLVLRGESALEITGLGLSNSAKTIKNEVMRLITESRIDEKDVSHFSIPDLKSREVNDVEIKVNYLRKNKLFLTNLGRAIQFRSRWHMPFLDISSDQVSDLVLNYPVTLNRKFLIKNSIIRNIESVNFEIDTPWVFVKRLCTKEDNDTVVTDKVIIKKGIIENADLKSEKYKELKTTLETYVRDVALILEDH